MEGLKRETIKLNRNIISILSSEEDYYKYNNLKRESTPEYSFVQSQIDYTDYSKRYSNVIYVIKRNCDGKFFTVSLTITEDGIYDQRDEIQLTEVFKKAVTSYIYE